MPNNGTSQHTASGPNVADPGHRTHGLKTRTPRDLPLEIVDLVFRHAADFQDAKRTIMACACVSRLWRELSIPHLFSSLKVVNLSDFDDFSAFLATHPDLARHIRILTLARPRRYRGMKLPIAEPVMGPNISHSGLADIVAKVPKLRELRLDNIFIVNSPIDPTSPTTLLPPPNFRLRKLSMHSCRGRVGPVTILTLPTLFDALTVLPADVVHLSWLTLACDAGDVTFDGIQLPTTRLPGERLRISDLVLDRISSRSTSWPPHKTTRFYDLLQQVLAPRCLRSFQAQRRMDLYSPYPESTFDKRNHDALRVLGDLLEYAGGKTLLHLSLPFSVGGIIQQPEGNPGKALACPPSPQTREFGVLLPLDS
ncbi:hypothetical protein C8Q70DRAFT_650689 [Cubamyces menziesii]|nr:hypothetical protein C8Q70DRAFT_650689 [Cubamyces menziesii]